MTMTHYYSKKKNLKNIAKVWTPETDGRLKELDVWKAGYLKSRMSEKLDVRKLDVCLP